MEYEEMNNDRVAEREILLTFRHNALVRGLTYSESTVVPMFTEAEVEKILLADTSLINKRHAASGRTLLQVVIETWPLESGLSMVRFLLCKGADPNIRSWSGSGALCYAVSLVINHGYRSIAYLLTDWGAVLHARPYPEWLILYLTHRKKAHINRSRVSVNLFMRLRRMYRLPREILRLILDVPWGPEDFHLFHECGKICASKDASFGKLLCAPGWVKRFRLE